MRARLLSWKDGSGWQSEPGSSDHPQLVLYFGERAGVDLGARHDELRAMFPDAHLVGCSTGGQISGNAISDTDVAAVAVSFDRTAVRLATAEAPASDRSYAVGKTLGRALKDSSLAGVFLLSDGLHVNGSALVGGLADEVGEGVPIAGGLAGDGSRFEKTLVGADCAPRDHLVAAIGLYGAAVRFSYGSAGGWDQFGPRRRITRSEGNVLYSLDGEPALDLYERYLGDESEGLPGTALFFPLRVFDPERPDEDFVRTVLAVDRDARTMTFAGDIPEGWVAQLMRGNFDRLAEGAGKAARLASTGAGRDGEAQLALLVSCIGRRLLMGQNTADEVEAVGAVLGDAFKRIGFYSYGEISPHLQSGCAQLHNQTMTIMTIREALDAA